MGVPRYQRLLFQIMSQFAVTFQGVSCIKACNVVLNQQLSLMTLFFCFSHISLGQYHQKMLSKVGSLEKIECKIGWLYKEARVVYEKKGLNLLLTRD